MDSGTLARILYRRQLCRRIGDRWSRSPAYVKRSAVPPVPFSVGVDDERDACKSEVKVGRPARPDAACRH